MQRTDGAAKAEPSLQNEKTNLAGISKQPTNTPTSTPTSSAHTDNKTGFSQKCSDELIYLTYNYQGQMQIFISVFPQGILRLCRPFRLSWHVEPKYVKRTAVG